IDIAVDRAPAKLELVRADPNRPGATVIQEVTLYTDSLRSSDLEGNFLGKLGLDVARPRAILGKIGADGPAARAGLQSGDEITAIDGRPVTDAVGFIETVRAAPGKALELTVLRDGRSVPLMVTPA